MSPRDTTQMALRTAQGGAAQEFEAVYDDETVTFTALITNFSTPVQVGAIMEATVSIKLTGAPTYEESS